MLEFLKPAVDWLWRYHRELTAGFVCLATGGGVAYLIAIVLQRLDRGGREPVGRLIALLACLILATLAAATNVAIRAAKADSATAERTSPRSVVEQIAAALHPADYAYITTLVILLVGAGVWGVERRGRAKQLSNPDAPFLLISAGGLLLATLWIFQRGVEHLKPDTTSAVQLFGSIAGAGVLSMAIVQGLRTLLPLRGVFHRVTLERWIDDATARPMARPSTDAPSRTLEITPPPSEQKRSESKRSAYVRRRRILRSITRLARGPVSADRYALLDLPIEQLCGQIAAGADRLLDAPFATTLHMRGSRHQEAQVKEVLIALAAGGGGEIDQYLKRARRLAGGTAAKEAEPPAGTDDTQEYVRLRASLSQRIQRNIDGLQIAAGFWWRRSLRGLAFAICGMLGLALFEGLITYTVICAIAGGFVATASRDLIAVVEKGRR